MHDHAFDALVRQAGVATDRRASLKALGAVGLGAGLAAALSAPTHAAKDNKAKKAKKKARKKCKQQREQCLTFLRNELCVITKMAAESDIGADGFLSEDECVQFFSPCCDFFAQCQTGQGLTCLRRRPPAT